VKSSALVTGANGFLGRHVARRLKSRGYFVTGLAREEIGTSDCFDGLIAPPLSFEGMVRTHRKYDVVVHCAGNGSVGDSIRDPMLDFKKTVDATAELLEYLRLYNPECHLIYPSSAAVYGLKSDQMIREEDSLNPVSPYGFSKRIAELLCTNYHQNFGLRISIIRFFSIYGPGLRKQLLWDACGRILGAEDKAVFWGTGRETRDWINIVDALDLIEKLIEHPRDFLIVNGGSGERTTLEQTLGSLSRILDAKCSVTFSGQKRSGDPEFFWSAQELAKSIGFQCRVPLLIGLERYVEWYRSNSD